MALWLRKGLEMRNKAPVMVLTTTLMAMMAATAALAQFGGPLGAILKGGGIAAAVKIFAPQINSFLNTILLEHKVGGLPATKVVPLVRVGSGTFVGAVQVAGRPDVVSQVQAALEGEANIMRVQARFLLPVTKLDFKHVPARVRGAGVSAVIDVHV